MALFLIRMIQFTIAALELRKISSISQMALVRLMIVTTITTLDFIRAAIFIVSKLLAIVASFDKKSIKNATGTYTNVHPVSMNFNRISDFTTYPCNCSVFIGVWNCLSKQNFKFITRVNQRINVRVLATDVHKLIVCCQIFLVCFLYVNNSDLRQLFFQ